MTMLILHESFYTNDTVPQKAEVFEHVAGLNAEVSRYLLHRNEDRQSLRRFVSKLAHELVI